MKLHITDRALRRDLKLPDGEPQLVAWDTEQAGFGVVVGRTRVTFVVNRRVDGKLHREAIGHWSGACGQCGDDGCTDPASARARALAMLGRLVNGESTPGKERRARSTGPTVAEACDLYLSDMRTRGKRPASIETMRREISDAKQSYVMAWLHRPLTSITAKECRARHEQITLDNGPHVANRVMREFRALWNWIAKEAMAGTIDGMREGTAIPANPTIAVRWNVPGGSVGGSVVKMRKRKQSPIAWSDLSAWHDAVLGLDGVRRDYHLLVLLTGLRRTDAATLRWEHVNTTDKPIDSRVWHVGEQVWDRVTLAPRSIVRPNPKGGADRAFTVPVSDAIVEILERRRTANRMLDAEDGGWVFPSTAKKSDEGRRRPCLACPDLGMPAHAAGAIVHISEPKEENKVIVSPHRLRDTYVTACNEISDPPLGKLVIKMLVNHALPSDDVTDGYAGALEQLRPAQHRVSEFLQAKMKPEPRRGRLRSVA
jgi:integrase